MAVILNSVCRVVPVLDIAKLRDDSVMDSSQYWWWIPCGCSLFWNVTRLLLAFPQSAMVAKGRGRITHSTRAKMQTDSDPAG